MSRCVGMLAMLTLLSTPTIAWANDSEVVLGLRLKLFVIGVIASVFLLLVAHMLRAMLNWKHIEEMPLSHIETSHPILPRIKLALWILTSAVLLLFCSLDGYLWHSWIQGDNWISWTMLFVLFGLMTVSIRLHQHEVFFERLYAGIIGSIMAAAFIGLAEIVFDVNGGNPFAITGLLVTIGLFWQFLFAPWRIDTKVIITAVFIAWLTVNALAQMSATMQVSYALAIVLAALPAAVWYRYFLWDATEHNWLYGTMFLAGMLATLPASLYRILTENGRELDLLFVRIVPVNIFTASDTFVSENAIGFAGIQQTFLATVLAFSVAAAIEEISKYWVLRHTHASAFHHSYDVLQCAVVVAIGFAFAENIVNPQYFPSFIQQHILTPQTPEWVTFARKIIGRSFLSTTAHVVASGTCGYFLGKSIFAYNYMLLPEHKRPRLLLPLALQWLLNLPHIVIWRRQLILIGISLAVVLHTVFNVLITLPTTLPNFPHSLSDIANAPTVTAVLRQVSISFVATLLMIGASLWLLMYYFKTADDMERNKAAASTIKA